MSIPIDARGGWARGKVSAMAKKLLLINPVCGILSTGRICTDIAKEYESKGWEVKIAYGRRGEVPEQYRKYGVRIGNMIGVYLHALNSLLFGYHSTGWCSKSATRKFVAWAEEWKPDVVWLHNLHDNYINVEMLFAWLKRHPEIEVKWTHHDCWAMTGCCTHFVNYECDGWRDECRNCKIKLRRAGLFGGSQAREFQTKKRVFLGIKHMEMISPSRWVAGLLSESFLGQYPVTVCHNKIDVSIFKYSESDFRLKHSLEDKIIVLGVSGFWESPTKGLSDFVELSKIVDEDYKIVLVGVSEDLRRKIPSDILVIGHTSSARELAQIYSSADVFFNPTHLDNYPTVNLEAAACGCPIITYDSGGTAETVEGYDKAVVLKGADKTPEAFLRAFNKMKEVWHGKR